MHYDSYENLVKQTFSNHGVDNPELEKAISDILNNALDSRALAKKIYKDVKENLDRDRKVRNSFR